MTEIIKQILDQPVATLLLLFGVAFLAIAAVQRLTNWIQLDKLGRGISFGIGLILLVLGVVFHLQIDPSKNSSNESQQTRESYSMPSDISKLFNESLKWKPIVNDKFNDNRYGWGSESSETDWGSWKLLIEKRYRWELSSKPEGMRLVRYQFHEGMRNFYVVVDVQKLKGLDNRFGYGVFFRHIFDQPTKKDRYYSFMVTNSGEYAFYIRDRDDDRPLRNWTSSSIIKAGEVNKIGVLAIGEKFALFINNAYVESVVDPTLRQGNIGLLADVEGNESAVVEFDNFVLRAPDS